MKRDYPFGMFTFLSVIFYVIFISFSTFSFVMFNDDFFKNLIGKFSFNTLSNLYMFLGLAYILANVTDKIMTNPKNFEVDTNGKMISKTSRKIKLWWMWTVYFIFNIAMYYIMAVNKITIEIDLTSVLANYVIVTILAMGANVTQEFFAFLPSPVANVVQKVINQDENQPEVKSEENAENKQ